MLDISGLLGKESEEWKERVNIPMTLIGGEFNNYQKIKGRNIKKTSHWEKGDGAEENDFVPFHIYDPSLMLQWILDQRQLPANLREPGFVPSEKSVPPGLIADRRNVEILKEEPIFLKRSEDNFFITHYYKRWGIIDEDEN